MTYTKDNDKKLAEKHRKEELEKKFGGKPTVIPPLTPNEGEVVWIDSKTYVIKKRKPQN